MPTICPPKVYSKKFTFILVTVVLWHYFVVVTSKEVTHYFGFSFVNFQFHFSCRFAIHLRFVAQIFLWVSAEIITPWWNIFFFSCGDCINFRLSRSKIMTKSPEFAKVRCLAASLIPLQLNLSTFNSWKQLFVLFLQTLLRVNSKIIYCR